MNPRIEQSCITISEKLFDFYDVYLHEVLYDAEAKYTARETMKLMNDETDKIDNDERAALLRENGVGDEMLTMYPAFQMNFYNLLSTLTQRLAILQWQKRCERVEERFKTFLLHRSLRPSGSKGLHIHMEILAHGLHNR